MIITIDGSAGTGKSTIAKKVAKHLHFFYFDTGAMYRSFTYFVLKNNVDIDDTKKVEKLLEKFDFEIKADQKGNKTYFVNGEDVSEKIRTPEITKHVSAIAAIGRVREVLVYLQREFALNENTVFEGRDMGTVVFPHADLKLFFTASPEIRAKRRTEEFQNKFPEKKINYTEVLEDLIRRDQFDSTREISPLKKAGDAIEIDTSSKSIDQVIDIVVNYKEQIEKAKKATLYPRMGFLYWVARSSVKLISKIFYRHKIYGKEHFLPGSGILAANHISFLDPPLVAASCPEELFFLAKKELFSIPVLGWFIRKFNARPVSSSASDAQVFKEIIKVLKKDRKVILFPEGTRSFTGEMGKLQQGVAFLGIQSKCLIFPIYIHGVYELWKRGKKWPKLFGKTACIIGSPIDCKKYLHYPKRQAMEKITDKLDKSLHGLKDWYLDGHKGSPP